ncbi:MAG: Kelch repeat-containing protein [Opitutaceae bacterium]
MRYLSLVLVLVASSLTAAEAPKTWEPVETTNVCAARHEAAMVVINDKLYLIGGRGLKPVNEYDPTTKTWKTLAKPPFQMHHFQAVAIDERIAIIGAFTGRYPRETPVPNIWFFDTVKNEWQEGPEIPEERRRGSAGLVKDGDDIYVVCGIVDGHWADYVPWFDKWNIQTGEWTVLPDAPRPRDHFHAAIIDGKIIAAAGRTTNAATKQVFELTVAEVDAFDIETQQWTTLAEPIPTQRAGTMALAHEDTIIVVGGERDHGPAHREVEAFSFKDEKWHSCTPLYRGRHGGGLGMIGTKLYVTSGSGSRGGRPELDDLEMIDWSDLGLSTEK